MENKSKRQKTRLISIDEMRNVNGGASIVSGDEFSQLKLPIGMRKKFNVKHLIGKTMKKEKTTMIKEDELKQIYGGCIEEPSLKTGPLTMEDILDPFLNGFKIH